MLRTLIGSKSENLESKIDLRRWCWKLPRDAKATFQTSSVKFWVDGARCRAPSGAIVHMRAVETKQSVMLVMNIKPRNLRTLKSDGGSNGPRESKK
jgi:hypothetical protein